MLRLELAKHILGDTCDAERMQQPHRPRDLALGDELQHTLHALIAILCLPTMPNRPRSQPRSRTVCSPPLDELLAAAVAPRLEPVNELAVHPPAATRATSRATQQDIMQAQLPLEPTLQ